MFTNARHPLARRPRAVTLIELLVVVMVMGLLMSLMIPAVQGARESARRAQCANNLKQIGQALGNHQATYGFFPKSAVQGKEGEPRYRGLGSITLASIHYQLLPFLGHSVLYNSMNIHTRWRINEDASNATSHVVVIDTFLCPSDSVSPRPGNNYLGCQGPNPGLGESPRRKTPGGGGAFIFIANTAPRDFSDGLSVTAGFSERVRGEGRDGFNRSRDIWYAGVSGIYIPRDSDEMAAVCASLRSEPLEYWTEAGLEWSRGMLGDTLYNHVATPNWPHADCSKDNKLPGGESTTAVITARSWHPGGVHVLYMDGSLRFVTNGVALPVWRAIASRAGREPVSELP